MRSRHFSDCERPPCEAVCGSHGRGGHEPPRRAHGPQLPPHRRRHRVFVESAARAAPGRSQRHRLNCKVVHEILQFYRSFRSCSAPVYPSSPRIAFVSDAAARRPHQSLPSLSLAHSVSGTADGKATHPLSPAARWSCRRGHPLPIPPSKSVKQDSSRGQYRHEEGH
ncbi:hypothetical protein B0T16DRAFT_420799 [Cercophora newfieldiana]|uniref:Uncharacterized protein n=1 Tax=Cercophora newfieldiana TaxID=92897 RepID=A0AA39XXB7_9PEZI|nr:hypothetical protein B0T16DRAFT_420799 [Cercophora newfieldiana]